jgi:Na+/H+ antiporter NhaD/arsenite permease-like protein
VTELQVSLAIAIFAVVILVIAFDLLDMTIAALIGVCFLLALGILEHDDLLAAFNVAASPLALLFGGMVVARVLSSTGMFERFGVLCVRATGGSGSRFLILLIVLVAPICALLPNATTVILLAPLIIGVCKALEVDFVGPMVLTAIVSNAAGMLTLVGDPATFLVGSSMGMTFGEYLQRVSLGGLLSVLVIVPLLPWLLPRIWSARVQLPAAAPLPRIERPGFVALALVVLVFMVLLFLIGEKLPHRLGPPSVAIIAATLGLLVVHAARTEPVEAVLRDVDWKTLVFLGSIFCLVEALNKTGLLQGLSLRLYGWFGADFTLAALALLACVGLLSTVLANIPVVAAALIMTKGYLVAAEVVPELALSAGYTDWPAATVPVFVAMMFGGTLGGNATLVGASANIVSAGICAAHGKRVSFAGFLRYGVPVTAAQLAVAALYVVVLSRITG